MTNNDLWTLPGIGGELQEIYMQTAQVPDYRFSWVAVVSLFSVVGSRVYRTPSRNYTPLSMMVLARSSSGKNHIMSFISECLKQSGLSQLSLNPTGCSSKQGLFGILKRVPSQIIVIDEAGHGRQAGKGDAHAIALKGSIMSLVTNAEGTFSLPATSERGLSDKDRKAKRTYESPIQHPALTYLELSTGEKLLQQVTPGDISSGELGRYLILADSGEMPTLAENDPPKIDLPDHIRYALSAIRYGSGNLTDAQAYQAAKDIMWNERSLVPPELRSLLLPSEGDIQNRVKDLIDNEPGFLNNSPDNPDRPPVPVVFEWEDETTRNGIFLTLQRQLLGKYWAKDNALHSKQHEIAMRLSLIYSLMDKYTRERRIVGREHALKAIEVVNYLIDETDKKIVPQIANSDVHRAIKVVVEVIKAGAGKAVGYESWRNMRAWRDLDSSQKKMSVLDSLQDYSIISVKNENQARTSKFNANSYVWIDEEENIEELFKEFQEKKQVTT